ncbi:uncharacterized protein SPAPADRAFT_59607 [Spathaspora passalidarum NRRL Y-27907]|uniref:Uncharacterized protein n=1 Tax=Spathaspora passalidarum (strain NRRL Y-27907 / 11-Y1) TaxID=619300 RepID=G3AHK7_SPAPN|nr:uncharacterized protein SPAPADRAFT_59607 [Spathaspora passalidarum NRRL Y-27907]EGW34171.1 hypothetical protein SPAPADRAFT_59607 [Spathaspora passalidarum NRRL Y-27907]
MMSQQRQQAMFQNMQQQHIQQQQQQQQQQAQVGARLLDDALLEGVFDFNKDEPINPAQQQYNTTIQLQQERIKFIQSQQNQHQQQQQPQQMQSQPQQGSQGIPPDNFDIKEESTNDYIIGTDWLSSMGSGPGFV